MGFEKGRMRKSIEKVLLETQKMDKRDK